MELSQSEQSSNDASEPATPVSLTTASLFAAIEEVVAEAGPDFVYESPVPSECLYLYNDVPSCLFGKALDKLGIDRATLVSGDNGHWGLSDLPAEFGMGYDAANAFQQAQSRQDHGHSYGDVLDELRFNLEKIGAL
jgi:hypothetical protein